jgi:hypothetical protein
MKASGATIAFPLVKNNENMVKPAGKMVSPGKKQQKKRLKAAN